MGNRFKLTPKVETIDFPKAEQGKEYDLKLYKKLDIDPPNLKEKFIPFGSSINLLKSGNILIAYYISIETGIRNFLTIYSLPNLKEIQTYEFKQETGVIYTIEHALQLKNGNILAIYDRFYEFDGENIKDGPIKSSTKISQNYFKKNESKFCHPYKFDTYITKSHYGFDYGYIFEEQEGLLLYSSSDLCRHIFSIKLENFEDIKRKEIYTTISEQGFYGEGNIDIILHSEYFPENVYLIINYGDFQPSCSYLRIHNYEDFMKGKCDKNNAINELRISTTNNVFGMCEYDKQYLLLDTITNNIYIFDMIKKEKIALCVPTKEGVLPGRKPKNKFIQFFERLGDPSDSIGFNRFSRFGYFYRKIHKLKDGKILIKNRSLKVVDVAMQKLYLGTDFCSCLYVITEQYIVSIGMDGAVYVVKIYKDDE